MKHPEFPTAKDMPGLVKIGPVDLDKMKNVKCLQVEKQMDKMKAPIFKVNWGQSIRDWTFTFFCNNVF